jgi:membrane protein DedA with SNARE-associated domain
MELVGKTILQLLDQHKYIFAFLGAFFEGTFIMLLAGVLYKLGLFKLWGIILVLIAGYMGNALMYYLIGRLGSSTVLEKWGKRRHLTSGLVKKIEEYFHKHSEKALFFTRITYGISSIVMIMAGSFKMKIKKYLIINFFATIIWVSALFVLGYVFGVSYKALGVITETIAVGLTIVLFIGLISFSVAVVYGLRVFARTKFIKNLENHPSSFLRRVGNIITKAFSKIEKSNDEDNKGNEN